MDIRHADGLGFSAARSAALRHAPIHHRGARGQAAEAIEQGLSGYRSELLTRDEARCIAANIAKLPQGAAEKPRASIDPTSAMTGPSWT